MKRRYAHHPCKNVLFTTLLLIPLLCYSVRLPAVVVRRMDGCRYYTRALALSFQAEPTVLLLDEPTSGLDATCASEVCAAMKALAKLGLTVVSVIHQPRCARRRRRRRAAVLVVVW
jgi:ABC-type histidine transport system ATPase subunit